MQFQKTNEQWYDSEVIYGDYYGCIVAAANPLASRQSLTTDDLLEATVYVPNRERFSDEYSHLRRKLLESNQNCLMYDGLNNLEDFSVIPSTIPNCIMLAPSHVKSLLDASRVKFVPLSDPVLMIDVSAIWLRMNDNPLINSFVKIVRDIRDEMGVDQLRGHF